MGFVDLGFMFVCCLLCFLYLVLARLALGSMLLSDCCIRIRSSYVLTIASGCH